MNQAHARQLAKARPACSSRRFRCRPYYVMEYVRGVPITKHCDDNKLTIRERLELFIQFCQAIQHAHQKGIVHRDIKPSNVLYEVDARDTEVSGAWLKHLATIPTLRIVRIGECCKISEEFKSAFRQKRCWTRCANWSTRSTTTCSWPTLPEGSWPKSSRSSCRKRNAPTRKDLAVGVDGQTAAEYEQDLEGNLQRLLNCNAGTVVRATGPYGSARRSSTVGPYRQVLEIWRIVRTRAFAAC